MIFDTQIEREREREKYVIYMGPISISFEIREGMSQHLRN
jgi:hypothetical protein